MTQGLILVRHGVTAWNREGRFQGHRDPPLAADGLAQARLLAERIAADPEERPVRIVSSPLARAAQTARIIAAALPGTARQQEPDVALEPRLMEIGQGAWEGRTHAELARTDARRYAAWRRDGGGRVPPGGEAVSAANTRVRAALGELLAGDEWPLCIVSHGGTLRLAARYLLGLEPRLAWEMDLDNASVSVISRADIEATWQVRRWNDGAHLLGRSALHVDESEGEPLAL
ncbi:MAG TPA: histidine phosphatase family protein [Candidatus Limnocylindria bacterium]